jgi:hypothetical protein
MILSAQVSLPVSRNLLPEYRHALYAYGEVGRFGRPKHDFLRLVIRHELKGDLVRNASCGSDVSNTT